MIKLKRHSIGYYYFKLVKQKGSPQYIARGVAVGLFVGFFIPFLAQMIVAVIFAFIFRAAKIPALACTWVTNYFTIPIIYPIQCVIGSYIISRPFSYEHIKTIFETFLRNPAWKTFSALGKDIILSFFAGGILFGGISALIGYYTALWLIKRHHERALQRKKQKERRLHRIRSLPQQH